MGLDVYLYRYENFEETKATEDKYEEESEKIWSSFGKENYNDITDEEKDEAVRLCNKLKEQLSINNLPKTEIELDSKKYPEHMFKIGYFRSSYNPSGTNSVLRDLIGMDLYTIFDVNDTYYVKPNWSSALIQAKKALDKLKEFKEKNGNIIAVETENPFMQLSDTAPKNKNEVIDLFLEERKKNENSPFRSYSSSRGSFFFDSPLKTLAFIPGKDYLGNKTVYLICEGEEDHLDWYVQALEIVIETCEYVLSQEDSDKYYLHWSG